MSWKREHIPDHKFDFVDVDDFTEKSLGKRLAYSQVFFLSLKGAPQLTPDVFTYMADLSTITILLSSNWDAVQKLFRGEISNKFTLATVETGAQIEDNVVITALGGVGVMFLLMIASIFFSFAFLVVEWWKAITIIQSRDISFAFTSIISYRYYTLRSYPHFCFFSQIQNSRKTTDVLAFWVFFKFKGMLLSSVFLSSVLFFVMIMSFFFPLSLPGFVKFICPISYLFLRLTIWTIKLSLALYLLYFPLIWKLSNKRLEAITFC